MDGWMDGEVLIIGRVVGWSGGVPKSLTCGDFRTLEFGSHSLFFGGFLKGDFFSIFADLGEIWGGFGRPKWELKSNFERFSTAFLLSTFGNRFFSDFFLFFSRSNLDFCAHSQCFRGFLQNRGFSEK